jgi:hypothetical protein
MVQEKRGGKMRRYKRKDWFLSLTKFILKTSIIVLAVLTTLSFAGVQPLASYKDTIITNTKSSLAHIGSAVPAKQANVSITDVEGESTFVISVEPNKDALDFEETYCVVLTAKDGYILSHHQVFWLASEFRPQESTDRSVQSNLNGLRIVRLSAPAMDKAIFPMRQEISQLVAEKKSKAEADFNEWFWDKKSLAPYTDESIQERYSVSANERASIARKYVDVRVMLYSDYLTLKETCGQ